MLFIHKEHKEFYLNYHLKFETSFILDITKMTGFFFFVPYSSSVVVLINIIILSV